MTPPLKERAIGEFIRHLKHHERFQLLVAGWEEGGGGGGGFVLPFVQLTNTVITVVEQKTKCYLYIFAHNFVNISAM